MDLVINKEKGKKGLLIKTWERCRSFGRGARKTAPLDGAMMTKSKTWPRAAAAGGRKKQGVAREGCFCVYVGPQKQRFVVKAEYANHPLFKMLLEEAELEYGYNSQGPLALPCSVDLFYKVLMEMDGGDDDDRIHQACGFANGCGPYQLLSPSRMALMNKTNF
ncbi:auxin-responsive protein SAUR50-like [Malania oleifera]|uniref:auxin-responsive protein SAUR50-like n=1 Tax=Malania oleifera TaxID=397392 RepID=UPI0025AE6F5A|nr:auxin-responsive protein SAUR50-like [Malania oleifera]